MTNETTWTADSIIELLKENPRAVDKAMVRLRKNHPQIREADDMNHIRRFSDYVQGLQNGRPKWTPKSLTDDHTKIFIAQGFLPKGTNILDFARELAIKHVDILCKVANGEKILQPILYLGTIRSGRYRDTEELWAYRNDRLPPQMSGFPRDVNHQGSPTEEHVSEFSNVLSSNNLTAEEFIEGYTIVYIREYYLD